MTAAVTPADGVAMPATEPRKPIFALPSTIETQIVFAAIAIIVALQLPMLWQRSINWDEFYYYSQVESLAHGTLTMPLLTLHTRIFAWLLSLPGSTIDHIIVARFAMLGCELTAAAALAGIAARFTDRITGLLCAAAYISGGYVFQHGFSFRVDPQAAALLMVTLYLLLTRRLTLPTMIACAILAAVATSITIKTVLYGPAFAGVLWLRWNEHQRSRDYVLRVLTVGAFAAIAFIAIYLLHRQGMANGAAVARRTVSSSAHDMFLLGLPPYIAAVVIEATLAPIMVLAIYIAPLVLMRSPLSLNERWAVAGLLAPMTTVLFYHNTAPYYYVYMLAPVVAGSAVTFALARRYVSTSVIALLLVLNAVQMWRAETDQPLVVQRDLLAAVHQMFPESVAYFDLCAMVGDFPKADAFMTPWGVKGYLRGEMPSYTQIMSTKAVPLLVEDDQMFTRLLRTRAEVPEFLPADAALLRDTYINLWGPIWVAGKTMPAHAGSMPFKVNVPGKYTVHGTDIALDGRPLRDGEVVPLARGEYSVSNGSATQGRIVWGRNVTPPARPAPTETMWTPF